MVIESPQEIFAFKKFREKLKKEVWLAEESLLEKHSEDEIKEIVTPMVEKTLSQFEISCLPRKQNDKNQSG